MMNKFISCALFSIIISGSHAQSTSRGLEIRELMWSSNDKNFAETEIPKKWENESAVVIAQSEYRAYKKLPIIAALIEQEHLHQRIKILDQSSLEDFAQFTYNSNTNYRGVEVKTYVGFKLIKADGKEKIVSESEAVEEDYETASGIKLTRLKLAIPNLEIGDILDYYIAEESTFPTTQYHAFDPAIFVLRKKYPSMHGSVSFAVLRRCHINLKTYNDAPQFELIRSDDDEDNYVLTYENQEKIGDLRWFYPYRSLPSVKFKVTYASKSAAYSYPNLINKLEPGVIKSTVSPAEVNKLVTSYLSRIYDFTGLKKYMKVNFKKETDKSKLAKEAFLFERNALSVRFAEVRTINGNGIGNMPPYYVVRNLSEYFKKAKIPHQLIVGVPRSIGSIDKIILEEELMIALKTKTEPPLYFCSFTAYSLPNEINLQFDGQEVYVSDRDLSTSINPNLIKSTLPSSKSSENKAIQFAKMRIDIETLKSEVSINKTLTGLQKIYDQVQLLDIYDFIDDEKFKYDMESITAGKTRSSLQKTESLVKEYKENREKNLNKTLLKISETSYDFKIDTVHSFQIIEKGRSEDQPDFSYEYSLSSEDIVKKAGRNFLIDIGKLIEKQIQIDSEQKGNREFDIYMSFPKRYESTVELEVPNGYNVQGLEKLNRKIENETGGFLSSAEMKDNVLTIVTNKYYSNNYEPAENWSKIIAFLDEADDFSEVQILLKKND